MSDLAFEIIFFWQPFFKIVSFFKLLFYLMKHSCKIALNWPNMPTTSFGSEAASLVL